MRFKQRNNARRALYRVEQHPTLSLLTHCTTSTMKTVCVALALVGTASAFVTPMVNVRATSTRYCRFLPGVLIRHVYVLGSVCDAIASRGNAQSAQECVALLCCTGGPSQWFHRASGRIPVNAHIFVRSRSPRVLFAERQNGCGSLGHLSGVLVRPRVISGRHTIYPPGHAQPTTHALPALTTPP